jgi:hypothetical protein
LILELPPSLPLVFTTVPFVPPSPTVTVRLNGPDNGTDDLSISAPAPPPPGPPFPEGVE